MKCFQPEKCHFVHFSLFIFKDSVEYGGKMFGMGDNFLLLFVKQWAALQDLFSTCIDVISRLFLAAIFQAMNG
jgi:hypothetical protein